MSKITKFFVLPSLVRCSAAAVLQVTLILLLPCLPERREAHSTSIHSTPTSTRGRKASHHNYISTVAAALFILWYKLNCGSIHDSHPERGEDEMIRFVSSSLKFQDMPRRQRNKPNLLLVADSTYYEYEGVGNKCRLALTERDVILDIVDKRQRHDRMGSNRIFCICQGVVMIPAKG